MANRPERNPVSPCAHPPGGAHGLRQQTPERERSGRFSRKAGEFVEVLITASGPREARRLARHLVERRLAACVNLHPVGSVYRWKGRVEEAREVVLAVKTTRARYPALEAEVLRLHSYEVPCVVALPVESGFPPYLEWIRGSSAPARGPGLLRSPPAPRSAMRRRRTRSRKRI